MKYIHNTRICRYFLLYNSCEKYYILKTRIRAMFNLFYFLQKCERFAWKKLSIWLGYVLKKYSVPKRVTYNRTYVVFTVLYLMMSKYYITVYKYWSLCLNFHRRVYTCRQGYTIILLIV